MTKTQTSLFNPKNYPDKQQVVQHKKWLASLTPSDKAYLLLKKNHLAERYHIYSGKECQNKLSFYLSNGNLYGDNIEKFYQKLNKINVKGYYHCVLKDNNPFKVHLYRYNGILMKMILKSFLQTRQNK